MKYLGRKILSKKVGSWRHRHDNCGEVPPRYSEHTEFWFEDSDKIFYDLDAVKAYIRKLKRLVKR